MDSSSFSECSHGALIRTALTLHVCFGSKAEVPSPFRQGPKSGHEVVFTDGV